MTPHGIGGFLLAVGTFLVAYFGPNVGAFVFCENAKLGGNVRTWFALGCLLLSGAYLCLRA